MPTFFKSTTKKAKIINKSDFAKSLGASPTGVSIGRKGSPATLLALKQVLAERLKSSGGRPSLEGSSKVRHKISFIGNDWEQLKKIAVDLNAETSLHITQSQIASLIVHKILSKKENEVVSLLSK
jgi:hypothetical protein